MLNQEKLYSLVGLVYDAAADPAIWPVFLEEFADAVGATTTAMVAWPYSVSGPQMHSAVRIDSDYRRRFLEYYYSVSPWVPARKTYVNDASLDYVGTSEQLVDFATLEKTEFYNDYLLPQDTVHQMACVITRAEHTYSGLTCLRPRRTGPFDLAEVEFLRSLLPHLKRAMQFYKKTQELERQYGATLEALNRLRTGVMLMDERGHILEMNRAASQMVNQGDGLSIRNQHLAASTPARTAALHSFIYTAGLTSRGKGIGAGGSMAIPRPSCKRPFSIVAMPLSRAAFPEAPCVAAVIVFIVDPESQAQTTGEAAARAYSLSRAESRVAGELMRGETLIDAAERLGISHNTARTHLQRIYQKTGTRHQGQLIRLLHASTADLLEES